MLEFLPVLIVGSIIGAFAIAFVIAYLAISKEKQNEEDDRHMSDKELVVRLLRYAKPYWKSFVLVLFIMMFSIVYDILSPLIVGDIQNLVKDDFELNDLFKNQDNIGVMAFFDNEKSAEEAIKQYKQDCKHCDNVTKLNREFKTDYIDLDLLPKPKPEVVKPKRPRGRPKKNAEA